MNTEQERAAAAPSSKGKKVSVRRLWQDIKKHKRLYYIVLSVTFILAAILALSIPNYYKCTVVLAPELSNAARRSTLSNLASSLGMNLGSNNTTSDAIMPNLYPELMNSVTFCASLFPIKVHRVDEDKEMTYYDYLLNEQKNPWWTQAKGAIFSAIRSLLPSNEEVEMSNEVNTFQLTEEQTFIVQAIGQHVTCDVDAKTFVITIDVTDQDPLIAAVIADTVQSKLQEFITTYRTSKVRKDQEYYQKLFEQSKERYEKALQAYASFSDANQKVFLQSVRTRQAKLENELQLELRNYDQYSAQLQAAKDKVQEETPAFTTLQPATVPILKAGPGRAKMCLVFLFLAFIGTTAYILHKEGDLIPLIFGSDD